MIEFPKVDEGGSDQRVGIARAIRNVVRKVWIEAMDTEIEGRDMKWKGLKIARRFEV